MLVVEQGKVTWPPPAPAAAAAAPVKKEVKAVQAPPTAEELRGKYMRSALQATAGGVGVLGLGAVAPDAAFLNMLTTFSLSGVCGYYTVWGVAPALPSPLMAVTNAISGISAVGGLVLLSKGLVPTTAAEARRQPRSDPHTGVAKRN